MRLSVLIGAVVRVCAAAFVLPAAAAFSPAGTVTFADLETIAGAVAKIAGKGGADPVLRTAAPRAIRGQMAAKLFGPMRKGEPGVAVCYVDGQQLAKLVAANRCDADSLARVKIWSVLYPATVGKNEFLRRNPQATADRSGTYRLPAGRNGKGGLYAWYSPDGKWAALSVSPAVAAHTWKAAQNALRTPLGRNLARIRMDSAGARAVFQTDMCAGATMTVSMGALGLEVRGGVKTRALALPALPQNWRRMAGVPGNSPFFGMTAAKDDPRTAEVLSFAGPEVAALVKRHLIWRRGAGGSTYYLQGAKNAAAGQPSAKLLKVLPEAGQVLPDNAMYCCLTTLLRTYMPQVAANASPVDSVKLMTGVRLLRNVRGDGMGFMTWREGGEQKFLLRISYDELRGTANLWSMMLM